MANIDRAVTELREMDDLASLSSPIHSLHPLAKLVSTIAYMIVTVSFDKYDLSGLIVMALYPALLFALSGVPVKTCFYKLRIVLPLVCAVGLFNPLLDRDILLTLGGIPISGGVISMVTLMLKGVFCLTASFLLAATTSMDALCRALRRLHVPGMIVTLLLLTYRYVAVMMEEVSVMTTAYRLRAPGQKGVHYKAWGSFLGQLLLRSMDKAEELYSSMRLRGFSGEFTYAKGNKARPLDFLFSIAALGLFFLFRTINIAQLLGGAFL